MYQEYIDPRPDGVPGGVCLITRDHQASYVDPIAVCAGEVLDVSTKEDHWSDNPDWAFIWCTSKQGKSGWIPREYVEMRGATTGIARCDYNAIELSVKAGEQVLAGQEECGWVWCTNTYGKSGWVPVENIAHV